MPKVIIDEKLIDEILTRGVEMIYPDKKLFKKFLMSGKKIKLYCGYDPSADSLHIGNAISINKMSQFQKLGHEVVFLIGDFTGMIGDPSDKSAVRQKMTREQVLVNAKFYKKQASAFLDFEGSNQAKVEYNSRWLDKLTFRDLIELTSNFTVQQMIQRDMFQKRLVEGKPIYLHEFMYPLAQGYDSVALDVDLEIGGNDQMFNMMTGRDLMKAIRGKEKFVMTLKLLADDSGKKMGKSEGNAVFLNETSENMYGIIMSWPDGVIGIAFELCTQINLAELKEIKRQLEGGSANPRDIKLKLAFEVVKIYHGKKKAEEAQNNFEKVFSRKEIPDEVESKKLKVKSINIINLLVETGLASSKGEARRLIQQNGIKLDGKIVADMDVEVDLKKEKLLQRGKRQFIKISAE